MLGRNIQISRCLKGWGYLNFDDFYSNIELTVLLMPYCFCLFDKICNITISSRKYFDERNKPDLLQQLELSVNRITQKHISQPAQVCIAIVMAFCKVLI